MPGAPHRCYILGSSTGVLQLHSQSTPLVTPARHDRLHMRENVPDTHKHKEKSKPYGSKIPFFLVVNLKPQSAVSQ